MNSNRLEAFSDGVLAIIITIMVLELRVPEQPGWSGFSEVLPKLFSYLLSFVVIAIYWMNHHHLIRLIERVNRRILWQNMTLMFCLSLVPYATAYLGEHHADSMSIGLYSLVLFLAGVAYMCLQRSILASRSCSQQLLDSARILEYKNFLAVGIYSVAVVASPFIPILSLVCVALPAIMYFFPSKRMEELIEA